MGGKLIDASNREAVELSIHTEAFRIVSTNQTARAAVLADIMVSEYKNFMQSLDSHLFLLSSFCDDMMQRLHGVRKDGFKAKTLWMKWQSTLTQMKKILAGLPRNYHTIKSGQQLCNVHKNMVQKQYKANKVSDFFFLVFSVTNFLTVSLLYSKIM